MDPYEVLGVSRTATRDEIQKRYETLIEECTLVQDENTQDQINIINSAYEMLTNNNNIYKEVRGFLARKNYMAAEAKLNSAKDRDCAEWNYLQGLISVQKGWFETGINYLRRAVELDRNNNEYVTSLNTIQSRIIEYATRYAAQSSMYRNQPMNQMNQGNNMNGCGGGNNNGGGGMC